MAKQDLYKTAQQSAKLFKLIQDEQLLESWVKNKIISAAEDISTVYQYLNYEKQFKDYSQMIAESTDLSESKRAVLTSKLAEAKEKVKELKKKAAKDKSEKMSEDKDEMKVGDTKKTRTGELTKTSTGVVHKNTSYHDDGDEIASNAKSGKGVKSHAKAQSAAEKKEQAPKQKQSPKSAKTWGMKDNEKFDNRDKVDEAKDEKCNHSAKGKKCPVHGLKECGGGMYEAKKTMSRAAKGHEKYGKEGMAALAKAGKEGKSLEPFRAKYNKYDEGAMPMKKVGGKSVPAFAADGKGKDDLAKKKASDKVKEAIARAKDVLEGKGKKKDKMDMEGNAFGKAVADAKKDGVQKGEKINVGGKDIPLKESTELDRLKALTQRLNG
jgi:hypothetical protein